MISVRGLARRRWPERMSGGSQVSAARPSIAETVAGMTTKADKRRSPPRLRSVSF